MLSIPVETAETGLCLRMDSIKRDLTSTNEFFGVEDDAGGAKLHIPVSPMVCRIFTRRVVTRSTLGSVQAWALDECQNLFGTNRIINNKEVHISSGVSSWRFAQKQNCHQTT